MAQQNELIEKFEQLNELNSAKNAQSKTAVEWLIEQVNGYSYSVGLPNYMNIRIDIPKEIIEQAKKIEEQRIIEFGDEYADAVMGGCIKRAKQFYEEDYAK